MKPKKEYKHFLRYDQLCFEDMEYGFTDLYYYISESTLYIKKQDHRNNKEVELDFPLYNKYESVGVILESYLINLMSYSKNFAGTPKYESSDKFSEETFNTMLEKGIASMIERETLAKLLGADNELIKCCKSIGLNPYPEGGIITNWQASCPSGGNHQIMISTKSNEWGCGYCRKKGDLNSLKRWCEALIELKKRQTMTEH